MQLMKNVIRFFILVTHLSITTSLIYGQPPRLNSYSSSHATVFLDFDGQYVSGTSWNWMGGIDAQASGLSNVAIMEIFNRVAEDYRPFNLNITTDSLVYFSAPFDKRVRVIITPTYEWYGKAGGISYVGSFNWGNETPAWVFSGLLNYNVKYIAEACSHETGHTLGLQHQSVYDENCNKIAEYNDGKGDGETGWAPIMGMGYYKNLTTWNTGPNTEGCNTIQNDLTIIAGSPNEFGFRQDDHGDDAGTATSTVMNGLGFSVNGLINIPGDIDAFKFHINSPVNLKLNAIPQNVGWGNAGADIDIQITMQDSYSNIIGDYNPALLLSVGIDTSLNAGDYYIMVSGTGNMNHSAYGSLGFYSLSANLGIVLPVHQFFLKASFNNGDHVLHWTYITDETIKNVIVEASSDGINFYPLVTLNADERFFSYRPFNNYLFYRLKAVMETGERAYYSGISKIITSGKRAVQFVNTRVHGSISCTSTGNHTYQLFDTGGRLLTQGKLINGMNSIYVEALSKGIFFMHISDGISDWTEKLIKQ